MAKVSKVRSRAASRRHRMMPYTSPPCPRKSVKACESKKRHFKALEKKDWEGATCSVCLEHPHNAVLLLCSSYNKGCRPYMCATGRRFSNCLEQYKKAYTKVTSIGGMYQWNRSSENLTLVEQEEEKMEVPELLCPLCRGQVKGWTVVEPARNYLNAKKRCCLQDKCSFVGTYKELRKHVKTKHPLARPRAVDPALEEKWKKLEGERERNDVISTIMSSTPGAVVLGDYVIEPGRHGVYSDYDSDESLDGDGFFSLDDRGQTSRFHYPMRYRLDYGRFDFGEGDFGMPQRPVVRPADRRSSLVLMARRTGRLRGGNRGRNQ